MKSEPTTHDYTRRHWGHDYGIRKVFSGGQQLEAFGWGSGISEGDFLILQNGDGTTRYQVAKIKYELNPRDMWFADLTFAPRGRS